MIKTPLMKPSSPMVAALWYPYILPFKGVLTMAHIDTSCHLGSQDRLPKAARHSRGLAGEAGFGLGVAEAPRGAAVLKGLLQRALRFL